MHNEKTKTRGKVMQTEKNTTFNMERKKAKKKTSFNWKLRNKERNYLIPKKRDGAYYYVVRIVHSFVAFNCSVFQINQNE